jgi:hypothetical protein
MDTALKIAVVAYFAFGMLAWKPLSDWLITRPRSVRVCVSLALIVAGFAGGLAAMRALDGAGAGLLVAIPPFMLGTRALWRIGAPRR